MNPIGKKGGGLNSMKRKPRSLWFLLLLLAVAAFFFFAPVKISLTPFLKTRIEAWKRLGITAEDIAVTLHGQVRARQVSLGNPVACRIDDLSLDVSLAKILKGRIVFSGVHGRSIQVDWNLLDAFFQTLEGQVPARYFRDYLSSFTFRGSRMEINGLVPSQPLKVEQIKVNLKWRPSLVADVEAQGIRLREFPALSAASFRFEGRPHSFRLENLAAKWGPIGLEGGIARDSSSHWEGTMAFKNVDMGKLLRPRLASGQEMDGILRGVAAFTTASGGENSFDASGSVLGENVRLRNLPFQRDPLIRDYMPALHDVRFQTLQIVRWHMRDSRLYLDSLAAVGAPLSIKGYGRIALSGEGGNDSPPPNGDVFFDLVGHLSEDYYRSLGPLAQSGLYRDAEGAPFFKFKVVGDFQKQGIRTRKPALSRVVKSLTRSFRQKLKSLIE